SKSHAAPLPAAVDPAQRRGERHRLRHPSGDLPRISPVRGITAGLGSLPALISATNGMTTTAAMAARILGGLIRLAHNGSGANLVSGVASTLLDADGA